MLVGRIKFGSEISGHPLAWQVMSNQYLRAVIFVVGLIVLLTITCYYFVAVFCFCSEVQIPTYYLTKNLCPSVRWVYF